MPSPRQLLVRRVRMLVAAAAACALALPAAAMAAPEAPSDAQAPAPAADRIVVEWAPAASSDDRLAGRDDADTSLVRMLGSARFQLVRPQPGQTVADALAALRADPSVRAAAHDGASTTDATTNDPLFGQLWGLQNLGAGIDGFVGAVAGDDADVAAAWDRTRGTPATVIADIDTGYRYDAPDLAPVAWTNPGEIPGNGVDDDRDGIRDDVHGADFVGPNADVGVLPVDGDPTDDNILSGGHGVHTAGTMGAAGDNGVGISGVAQDVRIMALRVCADSPVNNHVVQCPDSSLINAIDYAGNHGARAANMSLGGAPFNAVVRDAIASHPGTLYVISAGNSGTNDDTAPSYPCSYDPTTSGLPGAIDNIVCVAATDQADQRASFSNFGAHSVDIGAPGTEILSTFPVQSALISQTFEANDFASVWSTTGPAGFGRASAGDGPLTSFGMNDSPGAAPAAGQIYDETMTAGVNVPAGSGSCTLSGRRRIVHDGGSGFYQVLSNGGSAFFNDFRNSGGVRVDTPGSGMVSFSTIPITGLGGTNVRLHFGYSAGSSPSTADGLWLDDLRLTCYAPLSTQPTYGFLDGTSMAAPHVTGAAGLLFSLDPAASVSAVKSALLSSAHPVASLAGITTTGGRLDVAAALNALVPGSGPQPASPSSPGGPGGDGATTVTVRCVVPRLAGKTLRQAKTALSGANCALGRVTKPRARRGRRLPPLVVGSSKPRAGTIEAAGSRVALTLKPKPRPRPRHHRRHARRRRR